MNKRKDCSYIITLHGSSSRHIRYLGRSVRRQDEDDVVDFKQKFAFGDCFKIKGSEGIPTTLGKLPL